MKFLDNLTIGRRMALSFGAVILVVIAAGGINMNAGARLNEADHWKTHTYKVLETADGMLQSMVNMETGTRGFLLAGQDDYLAPFKAGADSFEQAWQQARELTADNPAQQQRLQQMKQRADAFKAVAQSLIESRRGVASGDKTTNEFNAEFASGKDKAEMDGFRTLDAEFGDAERRLLKEREVEAAHLRLLAGGSMALGTVIAALVACVMGWAVSRSITRPVGEAVKVAAAVAAGRLGTARDSQARDEVGQLMRELANMDRALVGIVASVRDASDQIRTGSSEIATGNSDLSQRTEEQASNLQQTAASMEQLTSTVRQNAEAANEAARLAAKAQEVAALGGERVQQVVQTMQGINTSSRQVENIIGVIDGIAFQTNILALNAAVEAARAGEQGRGFAVVASEVRTLAQRSSEAAREIKALIGRSATEVETGYRQVEDAGRQMADIVAQVGHVNQLIAEIGSATSQQQQGIEQVSDAVGQLDQVTQQNAALVEQSAASAESLSQQARRLVQAVSAFSL